jgi:pyridoxamine 5'-phosphate oxidase
MLPSWRTPIARALHRNRSLPNARYIQLATIDADARPTNRTVVFRGWLEPESWLQVTSDRRSQKVQDLLDPNNSRWAEVCWYFPKTREQFRLAGKIEMVTAACSIDRLCQARLKAWQQMSERARIEFMNPPPELGLPITSIDLDAIDLSIPVEHFCLLLLAPTKISHLELRTNQFVNLL